MGAYLTAAAVLMCPHGGLVAPIPTDDAVNLGGTQIVLASDTFPIGRCTFVVAGAPHPCVLVNWVVTALRATVAGAAPLTTDSVGFCVAADGGVQGPVLIQAAQSAVSGL